LHTTYKVFLFAACLIVSSFIAREVSAAPGEASQPATLSCAISKPGAADPKSKGPAVTLKRAAHSKRKAKPPAHPIVSEKTRAKAENITSEISPALPENLEAEISKFFGLRYQMGGEGLNGIDCSALVQKVYSDVFSIDLPRNSLQQSRLSSLENVTEDELKAGDLLFFGPKRKQVNHVGMYLAGGYFFHAVRSEGVTISRLDNRYWKSRWIFSKRVKGLAIERDSDVDQELERVLEQYSARFAFAGDAASETVSFLEGGINSDDSLEFLLSGFFMNALDDPAQPPDLQSSAWPRETETSETERGFRLATILSPVEWFKLIPSLTHIAAAQDEKIHGNDRQELGLETRMIVPSSGIALFMAARAKNQEDLFERPLNVSLDWQALDFALGFHYRLSDSLRFSLWGTRVYNHDLKENDLSGQRDAPLDDVSLELNFNF
jgi:cell wall-associated NlpC family hydrolase